MRLIGVEAAGEGLETGKHAASLCAGQAGRAARQPHLSPAGRERPDHRDAFDLRGPRLSRRRARARLAQGLQARASTSPLPTTRRSRRSSSSAALEGIIPALESAHALAHAMALAPRMPKDAILLVNLSGRGDKDMHTVAERLGIALLTMSRIAGRFEALARERRKALIPYITAGDPAPVAHRAADARAGRGGRRHHRARRAVLRPDGRRPGDPARERTRAQAWRGPRRRPRPGGSIPERRRKHADRADGLRQPDRGDGHGEVRRRRASRRRRRRDRGRLPAGGMRAIRRRGEARRHRSCLPARAHLHRRAHRARWRGSAAAISTTSRCAA